MLQYARRNLKELERKVERLFCLCFDFVQADLIFFQEAFDREDEVLLKVECVVVHIVPDHELANATAASLSKSGRVRETNRSVLFAVDDQNRTFGIFD
jgi:hypothetical protein